MIWQGASVTLPSKEIPDMGITSMQHANHILIRDTGVELLDMTLRTACGSETEYFCMGG